MALIDWIVLVGTIAGIIIYGIWKTRNVNTTQSYLQGDHDLKWWSIGLSIMATQASAITFLSTPGQAYEDGMGFAQFYFGLPLAMVILSVFVLPIYYKLKVYTAYEYLEGRFNLSTRTFTAILFLISRGLAAGLTIFAPAIILSTILGWQLNLTILVLGAGVTLYTVSGGTKRNGQGSRNISALRCQPCGSCIESNLLRHSGPRGAVRYQDAILNGMTSSATVKVRTIFFPFLF